jgi:hypothetical protein
MIGINFVVSEMAVQTVFNWPDVKRSRRLHKKLTKLLGPQISYKPASYQMADGRMVIHPALFKALKDQAQ